MNYRVLAPGHIQKKNSVILILVGCICGETCTHTFDTHTKSSFSNQITISTV